MPSRGAPVEVLGAVCLGAGHTQELRAARAIAQEDIRTVEVGRGGQRAGVSGAEAARRLADGSLTLPPDSAAVVIA